MVFPGFLPLTVVMDCIVERIKIHDFDSTNPKKPVLIPSQEVLPSILTHLEIGGDS